ncbi:MAG TPA: LuxR C-terminal-related transcriptional regulator [Kofleriaceae bacterium]|nr:LuxR C-terminal-related transcriptional regulator [Kofleriaceae bacterium]
MTTSDDWKRLAGFWRNVLELPAHDFDRLSTSLSAGLAELLGGAGAVVLLAARLGDRDDALQGWQLRHSLVTIDVSADEVQAYGMAARHFADAYAAAFIAGAGTERALLRSDAVTAEQWAACGTRRFLDSLGIVDHVAAARPIADGVELVISVHRTAPPAFTRDDADLLLEAIKGLGVVATRLARSFGLPGPQALSPRERQTLSKLLQGRSEAEVAHELSLSPRTVHDYVESLHRKLAVRSRGELLALWLGGA